MLGSFRPPRSHLGVLQRQHYLRPQRVCFQHRSRNMSSVDLSDSQYLADKTTPLCSLNVAKPFSLLTSQEKHYAHWIGQAGWAGARIIQGQWTSYGSDLYDLLIATFSNGEKSPGLADLNALQAKSKLDSDEWDAIMHYTVQVCLQLRDDNRAVLYGLIIGSFKLSQLSLVWVLKNYPTHINEEVRSCSECIRITSQSKDFVGQGYLNCTRLVATKLLTSDSGIAQA